MSQLRAFVYWAIPFLIWVTTVMGYTVAYGTVATSTSMPSILPALTSVYLGGVIPAIGFIATAYPTIKGSGRTSAVTVASIMIVAVLVTVWFVFGWEYGLRYQGTSAVYVMAALNALMVLGLLGGSLYLMRKSSFWGKIALHAVIWVWVGWYAFPWFGEWP